VYRVAPAEESALWHQPEDDRDGEQDADEALAGDETRADGRIPEPIGGPVAPTERRLSMKTTAILGAVLITSQLAACGRPDHRTDSPIPNAEANAEADAEASVDEDLRFLREEEKLARDVYLTLFEKWQLMPHRNIAESEQMHTDQVKSLLLARGIPDPVEDDTVGTFENPQLAALYTDLTEQGVLSEVASLTVGAIIEDLDIRDLAQMTERTRDATVLSVYSALQCGSRNHLRAFTSQLTMRGATYSPQYLDQAEYDAILAGAHERCGR
jgi:hypothetical protein